MAVAGREAMRVSVGRPWEAVGGRQLLGCGLPRALLATRALYRGNTQWGDSNYYCLR